MEKIKGILLNPIIFNYVFLFDLVLSKIVFANDFANFACKFFTVWAFIIIIYHMALKRMSYNYSLVLFVVFMLLTIFMNRRANLYLNLVMLVFVCCYLFMNFIKYDVDYKMIIKFNNLYIGLIAILSFFSILMYFLNFEFIVNEIYFGYHWNVLYGVFDNPNSGSIICVIAVFFIFMNYVLLRSYESKLLSKTNVFYGISLILVLLYLFIADSRGGQLTLISFFFMFSILNFVKFSNNKKIFKIFCSLIIFSLSAILVIKSPMTQLKKLIAINDVQEITDVQGSGNIDVSNNEVSKPIAGNSENDKNTEEIEDISDEFRKDSNISSSRFVLWKAGIKVIYDHPVFGVGQANVLDYVKAASDDDSIDTITAGGVHNGYIDLAVSNGLVGLILYLIGIAIIGMKSLKKLIISKQKQNSLLLIVLNAVFISILVNNLVETSMIMAIFATAQFFWMNIGVLNNIKER